MKGQSIRRRDFFKAAAAASTGGMVLGASAPAQATPAKPLIDEPFHGAVLNRRHGETVPGGLKIRVSGRAPVGRPVRVNGVRAERAGERFTAQVVLRERETDIEATSGDMPSAWRRRFAG